MVVGPTAQSTQSRMAHEASATDCMGGQSATHRSSGSCPASPAPHWVAVPSKGYALSPQPPASEFPGMTVQVGPSGEASLWPASCPEFPASCPGFPASCPGFPASCPGVSASPSGGGKLLAPSAAVPASLSATSAGDVAPPQEIMTAADAESCSQTARRITLATRGARGLLISIRLEQWPCPDEALHFAGFRR